MSDKPPHMLPAADPSSGRAATCIFLHGYSDDAEGLPLGLAQQFQMYQKATYLKWILPNAPRNQEAMTRAWYLPKALPNALKPRVATEDQEDESAPDDEEGIMRSVDEIDRLVEEEIEGGTPGDRIVVGGFSQGCAVSLVWGLVGKTRNKVAGVMCLSGYFPLAKRIAELRKEGGVDESEKDQKIWFYVHGTQDVLVPMKFFVHGSEQLLKWVNRDNIEGRVYEGLAHSTSNAELRDMLAFFDKVIPA
jgi:predicted esterase